MQKSKKASKGETRSESWNLKLPDLRCFKDFNLLYVMVCKSAFWKQFSLTLLGYEWNLFCLLFSWRSDTYLMQREGFDPEKSTYKCK